MLERHLEARVVRHCRQRGLYCRKLVSPANRGMPDRMICGQGKVLFLELKAKGKRPTPLQFREMALLQVQGMRVTWVDSYEAAVEVIDDEFTPVAVPDDIDLV